MGGTPHIPIKDIWSDVQTRVGTPHKTLRYFRSRGWTPHIPFEGTITENTTVKRAIVDHTEIYFTVPEYT